MSKYEYKYTFEKGDYVNAWKTGDWTGHFLGSYDVFINSSEDGSLSIMVLNASNWASFTNIAPKGTLDVSLVENINQSIECRCNQLTPFKTILPKWDRGETFFGLINLGGNYTQYYIWQE